MEIDPVIIVHGLFVVLLQTGLSIDGEAHWGHYPRRRRQRNLFTALHPAHGRLHFDEFIFTHSWRQRRCQISMPFIGQQTLRYMDWRLFSWQRKQIVVPVFWFWHRSRSMLALFTVMCWPVQFVDSVFIAKNGSFTFHGKDMRIDRASTVFCEWNVIPASNYSEGLTILPVIFCLLRRKDDGSVMVWSTCREEISIPRFSCCCCCDSPRATDCERPTLTLPLRILGIWNGASTSETGLRGIRSTLRSRSTVCRSCRNRSRFRCRLNRWLRLYAECRFDSKLSRSFTAYLENRNNWHIESGQNSLNCYSLKP